MVSPMRVVGVDHLQLAMPAGGEEAARAFYAGALAMTEVPKPEPLAARGGLWFESRGTALHLGIEDPFLPARKAHPALLVRDIDACAEALRAVGAPVRPDDNVASCRRLYTEDPFGNRIEIIADGEGFSQTSDVVRS